MVKNHALATPWTTTSKTMRALLALAAVSSVAAAEVVTNQFHVHIKRSVEDAAGLADQIAKDNGFHNLGPKKKKNSTSLTRANKMKASSFLLFAALSICLLGASNAFFNLFGGGGSGNTSGRSFGGGCNDCGTFIGCFLCGRSLGPVAIGRKRREAAVGAVVEEVEPIVPVGKFPQWTTRE